MADNNRDDVAKYQFVGKKRKSDILHLCVVQDEVYDQGQNNTADDPGGQRVQFA
jgi:hypothetical protein